MVLLKSARTCFLLFLIFVPVVVARGGRIGSVGSGRRAGTRTARREQAAATVAFKTVALRRWGIFFFLIFVSVFFVSVFFCFYVFFLSLSCSYIDRYDAPSVSCISRFFVFCTCCTLGDGAVGSFCCFLVLRVLLHPWWPVLFSFFLIRFSSSRLSLVSAYFCFRDVCPNVYRSLFAVP